MAGLQKLDVFESKAIVVNVTLIKAAVSIN